MPEDSLVCPQPGSLADRQRSSIFKATPMGVSYNKGYLRVPLKGYYKGAISAPLKDSIRV